MFAKYAPEFPCLIRGIVNAGKLQAEAFRGFTLHIVLETLPHQPRAYDAGDTPRFGEDRGPTACTCPTRRGTRPTRSATSRLRRRRRRADRQGHQPGRAQRQLPHRHAGQPRGDRPAALAARPRPRRERRPTCPTSACCWSARWPAGRRCRCDEAPRQPHRPPTWSSCSIFIVVTTLATSVLVVTDRQHLVLAQARLQGRVRRRHRRGEGRRHPDRRREGRHASRTSRSSTAPAPWSPSGRGHRDAQQGHPRHDPLPQPRRPALHLAHRRDRRHRRAGAGRHDPGRADHAGARPHRAVQRLQAALPGAVARPTSTSSPTRSSRSSRARAAPSRACSPTPPR